MVLKSNRTATCPDKESLTEPGTGIYLICEHSAGPGDFDAYSKWLLTTPAAVALFERVTQSKVPTESPPLIVATTTTAIAPDELEWWVNGHVSNVRYANRLLDELKKSAESAPSLDPITTPPGFLSELTYTTQSPLGMVRGTAELFGRELRLTTETTAQGPLCYIYGRVTSHGWAYAVVQQPGTVLIDIHLNDDNVPTLYQNPLVGEITLSQNLKVAIKTL